MRPGCASSPSGRPRWPRSSPRTSATTSARSGWRPSALDGLPADFVESHPAGDDGLVEITTDYPDYVPFMTFCRGPRRPRGAGHEFLNRAWPENDAVLHELLELRREHARLLGYDGWPSYDAEVKMIGTGPAIPEFIDRITEASDGGRPAATSTCCCARLQPGPPRASTSVDSVDKAFYTEVLRREQLRRRRPARSARYFDFAKVRPACST